MINFSKKYQTWKKTFLKKATYSIEEGLEILQKTKIEKFNPTINLLFHLNLNPKKTEQHLKGTLTLPHPFLKKRKICVFTSNFASQAKEKEVFLVGGKELIDEISVSKKINFDLALASPEIMPTLNKIAKLLGTKKLMPTVKNDTLADDLPKLISRWQQGQQFFQNDSYGNLNFTLGKFSDQAQQLLTNFNFIYNKVLKIKPAGIKGKYIKKIVISTTMGPGLKIGHQ